MRILFTIFWIAAVLAVAVLGILIVFEIVAALILDIKPKRLQGQDCQIRNL